MPRAIGRKSPCHSAASAWTAAGSMSSAASAAAKLMRPVDRDRDPEHHHAGERRQCGRAAALVGLAQHPPQVGAEEDQEGRGERLRARSRT